MRDMRDGERLSWGDAAFLYLERDGMPINVAGISIFEGIISFEDCRDHIESKLPLIPRYRQRITTPPFNLGLPIWEWDTHFDINNHIRQYTLKQGTDEELKEVAGDIISTVMNRDHPLWDFTIVRGLKGNRTAIIARVHHCLVDGVAGVGLMNIIMDDRPDVARPTKRQRFVPPPPRDAGNLLLDGVLASCFNAVQTLVTLQSEMLSVAETALASGGWPVIDGAKLLPELAKPTQRLHFNRVCQGPQKFAWAELPLTEIKAVKNAFGVTVNDVVLAVITSTFKRYAELHGTDTRDRILRIVVPVNLRNGDDQKNLGNKISFLPLTVPLDITDAAALVAAVHKRMTFFKKAGMANLVNIFGTLLGTLPTSLSSVAGPVASQLPISVCNLICTNVPGPQMPLYLLGHKMVAWYPYVPIGGEMGVNCAILTYDGTAYFGFGGDVQAAPDIHQLEKFVVKGFADLKKAAGIRTPRKARPVARHKTMPVRAKKLLAAPSHHPEITKPEPSEKVMAAAVRTA